MLPQTPELIMKLLGDATGKWILNLGSSTEHFYKIDQPFIWNELLEPLNRKNLLVNADIKKGLGIDLQCPLNGMWSACFDILLCNSLLEHVECVEATVKEMRRLIKPDGILIADVPTIYPHHEDPIDNGLRIGTIWGWKHILRGFFTVDAFVPVGRKATLVRALPC